MEGYRTLRSLSLGDLRAFEAAARRGSFRSAAEELGVTPAAISHRVKGLEAALGVLLFERLHRAVRPTRAGCDLSKVLGRAFGAIEEGLEAVKPHHDGPRASVLTVTSAPTIAARWLGPRLPAFETQFPQFRLRLLAENALADVARDPAIDVALRYGGGPYASDLRARPLWDVGEVVAVCAPAVIAERGFDPLDQPLLNVELPPPPRGARRPDWTAWLEAAGYDARSIHRATRRSATFSNTQLVIDAAIRGRGHALAPTILVADDLGSGALVRSSPISLADPYRFWVLYKRDEVDEPRIRAFVGWLMQQAGSNDGRSPVP